MPICTACGADGAKHRCAGCKEIFYCSKGCQKRNWKLHKGVCTTDPSLRPYIPVEMAIERAFAKQPPIDEARTDAATCYISLEGAGEKKLVRGCACRGDSAGFVHLECLTKFAISKEETGDENGIVDAYRKCMNCEQFFKGAFELEIRRRCWRRYRSSQHQGLRYVSTKSMAVCLDVYHELDAANSLFNDALKIGGYNKRDVIEDKIRRASQMAENFQFREALELLTPTLPEAKACTANLYVQGMTIMPSVLLGLGRNQDALETSNDLIAFAKANFGPDGTQTLISMRDYAVTCLRLGRIDESKAMLQKIYIAEARIFGRDHPRTQETSAFMQSVGFATP